MREVHEKGNIIFAVEEPETSQHPDNQRLVIEALQAISDAANCQVMLTTHVPALASLLPVDSIRYVYTHENKGVQVRAADEDVIRTVATDLGVVPDKRAKVLVCVEGPYDIAFLKNINQILCKEDDGVINIFNIPEVAFVVLGGSNLQDWVNQHYLKNVGLPEVHIYDKDKPQTNGEYKYQDAVNEVNLRQDGSIAFLTSKREMENYLHIDAINEVFRPLVESTFEFSLTDDCDVEVEIKNALNGRGKIKRHSIKYWLNHDATSHMNIDRLKQRNGYSEIKGWFSEIAKKVTG